MNALLSRNILESLQHFFLWKKINDAEKKINFQVEVRHWYSITCNIFSEVFSLDASRCQQS